MIHLNPNGRMKEEMILIITTSCHRKKAPFTAFKQLLSSPLFLFFI